MGSPNAKFQMAVEAIDGFSAPFQSLEKRQEKFAGQVKKTAAEMRRLGQAKSAIETLGAVGAKVDASRIAMEGARAEVRRLSKEIRQSEAPTEKMSLQLAKARARSAQLGAAHAKQNNKLKSLKETVRAAGVDVNNMAAAQKNLEERTKVATAALSKQRAGLDRLKTARQAVNDNRAARAGLRGEILETAAMGYVAARPIMSAVNYESSFADVKKVVDFGSDQEAAAFSKDVLKMSTSIPMAASGIAEIVAAAGQSGVAKDELLGFAEAASKASVAWDVSAGEAGSTMAAWRSSMKLSQAEAVSLADATNHLSNNMNAKARDVADVLSRQGAVAMSAGFSATQSASLAAALLSGGATSEVASTAMKNITGALMRGDTATGAQKDALSSLGFDPQALSAAMISDAPGTLIEVFEALQDVPADQLSSVVSSLFGEEVKGSVMPLLKNLDNLRGAFKMTAREADYAGSMQDEYAARSKTTANNLQLLGNKFERIQITVGTLLLPTLNDLMGPVADFADLLGDAAEEYPRVAQGLTMAAMAFVGVKTAALAMKFVGLQFGQGANVLRAGRAKLSATTNDTALSANRATSALARMNAQMRGMGGGFSSSSAGSSGGRGKGKRRGFGRRGRIAAMLGSGAALSMLATSANAGETAMLGADLAGAAGSVAGGAAKFLRPLDMILSAAGLTSAIANGDAKQIGATGGDILGGLGGGAAGAALGTLIFPGVGTAIGGLLGSMGGGAIGEWVGEKAGSLFSDDKSVLPSPDEVSKSVKTEVKKEIVFAPQIEMPASSGNPEMDRQLVERVVERLKAELVPVMSGDAVAHRLDGSLSDTVS